jgi:signal transduction histidine kinase
MMMCI